MIRTLILVSLAALFSLSSLAGRDYLRDKHFCSSNPLHCAPDTTFVQDHLGRCGCLQTADFLKPERCRTLQVICDERAGKTYSSLFSNGDFVGCGCYKTN